LKGQGEQGTRGPLFQITKKVKGGGEKGELSRGQKKEERRKGEKGSNALPFDKGRKRKKTQGTEAPADVIKNLKSSGKKTQEKDDNCVANAREALKQSKWRQNN